MIFHSKRILFILLLMTIPIMILFYSVPNPINCNDANVYSKENEIIKSMEKINPLIIQENNNLICDTSTGICGPPPGWYSTD